MIHTYEELVSLIAKGESKTLELKKSTGLLKAGCETLCGFLNQDGGILLIGVFDQGAILGQECSDKTKQELDWHLSKIEPTPQLEIVYLNVPGGNKQVLVIHAMTDSRQRPFLYDGRAYLRTEAGTRRMTHEELHYAMLNRAPQANDWEYYKVPEADLADLDHEEILATVAEGIRSGRLPEEAATQDPWIALQHLDLVREEQLTRAAILAFGKKPEKFFPQCLLRLARFRGVDKTEFIDNKQIYGNIFTLIRAALRFANEYLPIASTFPKGALQRLDQPLFPIIALREAIANAVCHRDYSRTGGSVSLAIFDDRLEIWSYGLLPSGLEVKDLLELNQSLPRNHRLANVLYYHRYFERWGRGIKLIIDECVNAGHPAPYYIINTGGVLLTMPSKQSLGPTYLATEQGDRLVTEDEKALIIAEPIIDNLHPRQKQILALLTTGGPLNSQQLHDQLQIAVTRRTLHNDLMGLLNLGFVRMIGQSKSTVWQSLISMDQIK